MKAMTYKQLSGACDQQFRAHTFEEMAEWIESKRKELDALPEQG